MFATSTLVPHSLVSIYLYLSSHDFQVFAQSLSSLSWEPLGYYSHKQFCLGFPKKAVA